METCVLIPQEFSLAINSALINNQTDITVWTSTEVQKGQTFHPFQGTIRLEKLNICKRFKDDDIRYQYGLYDEVRTMLGKQVRLCNWLRFIRISENLNSNVNIICTKFKEESIFETIKPIAINQELVVFFIPLPPEEHLFKGIRTTLYRNIIDNVLQDTPLDLSMSLLHQKFLPESPTSSGEDDNKTLSNKSFGSMLNITENVLMNNKSQSQICSLKNENETPKVTTRSNRSERTLLPCGVCGKTFDRPSLLKRHMRTHTGEKPHVCVVCGKGFSTSSSLNTHRRIHSGEKPHECQVCGKRFTASSNLYYHRMTHVKEKPHKCNLCSKSFPTPGDLKSHMYIHSGSWPFKCHICFRGFSKQTNLKNHLFLHTGNKPHVCELCNKKFALACNLRAHMKTHEGEPRIECNRCGKMHLVTLHSTHDGVCSKCLDMTQFIDGTTIRNFRYNTETGSEDESSNCTTEISEK